MLMLANCANIVRYMDTGLLGHGRRAQECPTLAVTKSTSGTDGAGWGVT